MNQYQVTYMDKSTEIIEAYSYDNHGRAHTFYKSRGRKVERNNVWYVTLLATAEV